MEKSAICKVFLIACFCIILVTNFSEAEAEDDESKILLSSNSQKVIFVVDSVEYWDTVEQELECRPSCREISDDLNEYLQSGWQIISSTERKIPVSKYCVCIGTQYVLEK